MPWPERNEGRHPLAAAPFTPSGTEAELREGAPQLQFNRVKARVWGDVWGSGEVKGKEGSADHVRPVGGEVVQQDGRGHDPEAANVSRARQTERRWDSGRARVGTRRAARQRTLGSATKVLSETDGPAEPRVDVDVCRLKRVRERPRDVICIVCRPGSARGLRRLCN